MPIKEIKFISKICSFVLKQAELYRERKRVDYLKTFNINGSNITSKVEIFHPQNVHIGEGSYMNGGQIHAGPNSTITIGKYCAIGYNVHIKSYTHDPKEPTGRDIKMVDQNILIGDHVWIGDNVYIKEGIRIGNNVIVGANSVVTKSVEDYTVVAGCPAKLIYKINK